MIIKLVIFKVYWAQYISKWWEFTVEVMSQLSSTSRYQGCQSWGGI